MKAEQVRRKVDSLEILRCRRILEIRRNEAMRSLDRLEDEARSLESDCPKDVGDLCAANLSKDLFQQRDGLQQIVRMTEAALDRIQQGTFGVCAGLRRRHQSAPARCSALDPVLPSLPREL